MMPQTETIAFVDLGAQRRRLGGRVERAISRVLEHGQFILGPEVAALEDTLAAFARVPHVVTCASGTDALLLPLLAWGVGPGDAVVVPTFVFAATAEVVALVGATPVFADVLEEDFNLDPDSVEEAIQAARALRLRPVGIIAADLFGQLADYARLEAVAQEHGCWVIADTAQSFGANRDGRRSGSFGDVAATSFFPAKPLGCYGDGGAVFAWDADMATTLRSLRAHGQGADKYDNVRVGMNARLDTLQAAVLLEKLTIFESELALRQQVAVRYSAGLDGLVRIPEVRPGDTPAWAQYTIVLDQRDRVAERLRANGVPVAVYYRVPLHRQRAYSRFPTAASALSVSERLASTVLSLPMHPYLTEEVQDKVIDAVREAVGE